MQKNSGVILYDTERIKKNGDEICTKMKSIITKIDDIQDLMQKLGNTWKGNYYDAYYQKWKSLIENQIKPELENQQKEFTTRIDNIVGNVGSIENTGSSSSSISLSNNKDFDIRKFDRNEKDYIQNSSHGIMLADLFDENDPLGSKYIGLSDMVDSINKNKITNIPINSVLWEGFTIYFLKAKELETGTIIEKTDDEKLSLKKWLQRSYSTEGQELQKLYNEDPRLKGMVANMLSGKKTGVAADDPIWEKATECYRREKEFIDQELKPKTVEDQQALEKWLKNSFAGTEAKDVNVTYVDNQINNNSGNTTADGNSTTNGGQATASVTPNPDNEVTQNTGGSTGTYNANKTSGSTTSTNTNSTYNTSTQGNSINDIRAQKEANGWRPGASTTHNPATDGISGVRAQNEANGWTPGAQPEKSLDDFIDPRVKELAEKVISDSPKDPFTEILNSSKKSFYEVSSLDDLRNQNINK